MTSWLQHASSVTAKALHWLPGWAVLLVLAALAAVLAWVAVRARRRHAEPDAGPEAADTAAEADGEIPEMAAERAQFPAGGSH
jgi:membrane protein implicated in regulation of membrane protease activity